ncbi:DNA topoisomerase IV subunit A [Rhodoligotrophos ferricapiens]|uniref:DNA topoisomerase IV subunit A n=1 Tax=Rhodoligotrophos ferricapiens TaxID=3069264 RepID=UPI00315CC7ED
MSDLSPPPIPGGVEQIALREALEERYLAYALSTIMHRALPDVRDGLKPVHRRLLYAMRQLRLDPNSGFKKCARVVGDVIGRYHPHGDQSVYDALVRLAQDFAVRYPLVDGQGNFGNIDGDNPAAMRYTEARLTEVAQALLDGLDEDTVDFRDTYDGEDSEPVVLPGAFPNLLANGSSGIAVGMATSIPPHNAHELCDAALHLIKSPNASIDKIIELVPGPDFPTGGIIIDDAATIRETYRTGRGAFRVRAKWEVEELKHGTWQIVITEMPYQVQKGRLVEKIADLINGRKLPLLADVRDESAEDVRLVLEPRSRTVDATVLMEQMFRLTELETRIPLNMNVLTAGRIPRVLSLPEALRHWLDHRKEVLVRRSRFRLEQIAKRLEILEGYLIAYLNLDEVIRIIREEDEPKAELIRAFKLTDNQAEAILNMRLRSLRKLEEMEIRREHENLTAERAELTALLASDELQWATIAKEIRDVRAKFSKSTELGRRRTEFAEMPSVDVDLDQVLIEREPITVVLSEKGWIRALKGHLSDASALSFKEGDKAKFSFPAETTDKIMVFSSSGKFFTIGADKLPGGRGHGEPLRLICDLDTADDVVALFVHKPGSKLIVAASDGRGFLVSEDDVIANTRKGKQVLNVSAPVEAQVCRRVSEGADHVAVIGENRKLLIFPMAELPEMGRGRGVKLQSYRGGGLADAKAFARAEGLTWTDSSGRLWTVNELDDWLGSRAQAGRIPPKGFPRNNRFG